MDSSWKPETFSVEEIVNKIKNKSITVPLYQRGQVWEEAKEKALIESIKLCYPFGSILLYKKPGDEYHLIDGLQRCTTFYRYLEDPAHYFDSELDVDDAIVDKMLCCLPAEGSRRKKKLLFWPCAGRNSTQ